MTAPMTGAVTTYTYDSEGRVRTVTQPDGYAVTTDYDAFDRPTRVTYPDATTERSIAQPARPRRSDGSSGPHDAPTSMTRYAA